MTDDDLYKINAIVGSAIRALAESGVDDAALGAFAANHRAKVAAILGQEKEPEPVDIEEVVFNAVKLAMDATKGPHKARPVKATRLNVRVSGKRTMVCIRKDTLEQLIKAKGSLAEAKVVIQAVAQNVPADIENRSAWIETRLLSLISFGTEATQNAPRH